MEIIKYEIGQVVDLVIQDRRNACEIISVIKNKKNGISYDVIINPNYQPDNYVILENVSQSAFIDFEERITLKLRAPSKYTLIECLEELKMGRRGWDQKWIQEQIDSLKSINENSGSSSIDLKP